MQNIFKAISTIKDKEKIQAYYMMYVNELKKNGKKNAKSIANFNIGYILGYFNKPIADTWLKALPTVSHPVFGRKIPWDNITKAYKLGHKQSK